MDNTHGPNQYWSQPLGSLLTALRGTPDGLSTADARQRLEEVAPNVLEAREKATALGLFLNQFKSPIIWVSIAW